MTKKMRNLLNPISKGAKKLTRWGMSLLCKGLGKWLVRKMPTINADHGV